MGVCFGQGARSEVDLHEPRESPRVLGLSVYGNPRGGEDPKGHPLFALLSLERVMCPEGAGGGS